MFRFIVFVPNVTEMLNFVTITCKALHCPSLKSVFPCRHKWQPPGSLSLIIALQIWLKMVILRPHKVNYLFPRQLFFKKWWGRGILFFLIWFSFLYWSGHVLFSMMFYFVEKKSEAITFYFQDLPCYFFYMINMTDLLQTQSRTNTCIIYYVHTG